jgi:hypothetical protein
VKNPKDFLDEMLIKQEESGMTDEDILVQHACTRSLWLALHLWLSHSHSRALHVMSLQNHPRLPPLLLLSCSPRFAHPFVHPCSPFVPPFAPLIVHLFVHTCSTLFAVVSSGDPMGLTMHCTHYALYSLCTVLTVHCLTR